MNERIYEIQEHAAEHLGYIKALCTTFSAALEKELNTASPDGTYSKKNRETYFRALRQGSEAQDITEALNSNFLGLTCDLKEYCSEIDP